jgi:outer membrane protein assembly factor BamB
VKSFPRIFGLVIATFLLASCSWFGGKDDDELMPAELTKLKNTVDIRKIWTANLGGEAEFLRIALRPTGDVNRVFAASRDGVVSAYIPESGKRQWRTKLDIDLSAGPGYGHGVVAVAAADGELVVLDAATGEERWRKNIGGESLAQPLIEENLIIILTIDNRLRAFSVFDGSERWSVEQPVPLLTVRGSSTPVIVGSTVITGFDNGRLVAVNLGTGDIEWEAPLSAPSGRSDLERLSDIDGQIAVVGQDVYAVGYQGEMAAVVSESGQPLWLREVSSFEGVSADWNNIYSVTDDGEIVAIARLTGTEAWRQVSLLRREPTLPVAFNAMVVTGDFEGYVHFFSNLDGTPVARVSSGYEAVTSAPVVIADRLYIQSDSGRLIAYAVRQPKAPRNAPEVADEETE